MSSSDVMGTTPFMGLLTDFFLLLFRLVFIITLKFFISELPVIVFVPLDAAQRSAAPAVPKMRLGRETFTKNQQGSVTKFEIETFQKLKGTLTTCWRLNGAMKQPDG